MIVSLCVRVRMERNCDALGLFFLVFDSERAKFATLLFFWAQGFWMV